MELGRQHQVGPICRYSAVGPDHPQRSLWTEGTIVWWRDHRSIGYRVAVVREVVERAGEVGIYFAGQAARRIRRDGAGDYQVQNRHQQCRADGDTDGQPANFEVLLLASGAQAPASSR